MKNILTKLLILFFLFYAAAHSALAQNPSAPSRVRYVSSLPATCNHATGEIAVLTSVSPTEFYYCSALNTWTKLGTVTSVGLSLPSIFSVSGSPVTTSGTLTAPLATQTANTIFSGPTTGSSAQPSFRAMVAADQPTTTVNSVTNDTNVTGSIATRNLTLGWTGTLADARIASASTWNAKIGGSGSSGKYAKFTASGTIGDALLSESGSSITGAGTFEMSGAGAKLSVKPGSRSYVMDADDPSGAMRFSRSDVSGTYLTVIPASSNVSFSGVNSTNNADFVFSLQGGKFVFTPAQAGGAGTIQFGRRYSDSSNAVGASVEFWPTTSQTTPTLASVNPGGGTYRWKVMPSAATTIGLAADEVGLTIKGHSTQTSNLQEWRNTSNTLVGSFSNGGVITADGSGLTNLSASNLATGTVPLGRLSGITTTQLSGSAGITNAQIANSSVTVTAGTGLTGGGSVSLGSSVTLNRPTYVARATHNADQSIADSTGTTVALNSEHHDTDSIHSTVTNNERLTAQHSGYYRITGTVTWGGAAGGTRTLYLRLNGSDFLDIAETDAPGANRLTQKVTATYYLNTNDYVDLRVVQTSGSTINIVWLGAFGSNYKNGPILEMEWVGP